RTLRTSIALIPFVSLRTLLARGTSGIWCEGFIRSQLGNIAHCIPAECIEDAVCDRNDRVSYSRHWGLDGPSVCCWIVNVHFSRPETSYEVKLTVDHANAGAGTAVRDGGSFSSPRVRHWVVGIDCAVRPPGPI